MKMYLSPLISFLRLQQVGAGVDRVDAEHHVACAYVVHVVVRADVDIRNLRRRVAQRARAEQRQHDVRAAADTPVAQGLAEVLVVALQPHRGRHVDQASQTEGAVEQQPAGVHAGVAELGLQQVVGQVLHVADVIEEVVHPILDEVRGDLLVALGQRFQRIGVQGVVEGEDGRLMLSQGSSSLAARDSVGANARLAQARIRALRSIQFTPRARIAVSPLHD
ncbi:Uncharacterised protein [Pseudomonas aeruginosa]|nr:Uncharacterised protein [Pseudomonas aeruginosa]